MPSEVFNSRTRKIAEITAATSKVFANHEITAQPFPSLAACSGWTFTPDGFAGSFLLKLKAIDQYEPEQLAHVLYEKMTGAGFAVEPLPVRITNEMVAVATDDLSRLLTRESLPPIEDAPKPRRSRAKKLEPVS